MSVAFPGLVAAQAADLFFSEYIEGSSFNKAIEIYNGTGADVDLGAYTVALHVNGSASGNSPVALSGTLADGDVYVIAHASANAAILAVTDLENSGLANWNGDDGVVLAKSGSAIDVLGQIVGIDPGSQWGTGDASTADNTLRRKAAVCSGDDDGTDAFDPAVQWDGLATDTFDGLGSHTASCGPATPTLTVSDIELPEGDSGTTLFAFDVTLDVDAEAEFTVNWHIEDDSATAADGDFVAASGQLTFDGGLAGNQVINVSVNGDAVDEGNEVFRLVLDGLSGATVDTTNSIGVGTILNDDAAVVAIHTIQGSSDSSPLAGSNVAVEGIVTAVTVSPPAAENGFFVQTPDADADADPLTSEGLFIYTGGTPAVQVGDTVKAVGLVEEFFGLTQLEAAVVVKTGTAPLPGGLPIAVGFDASLPSPDPEALSCPGTGAAGSDTNFECFEGMRVAVADGVVTRANLRRNADVYAEAFVTASGARSRRERGLLFGSTPTPGGNDAAGSWDGNPEVFEMDADEAGLTLNELTNGTRFGATGVLGYSFGDYEFYPVELSVIQAQAVPEAVMASAGGDELTIASFNVGRLCDTTGTECDGTVTADEYALKRDRIAAYIIEVLGTPDIVGVQEVETAAVLTDLAARIATVTLANGAQVQYSAFLVEGNDPGGIDVGFLTRDDRISGAAVEQFYKLAEWFDPNGGTDVLHDRPPLLLTATFNAPSGARQVAVLNNHLKARTGVDEGDERDRAKRFFQSVDLANLVQQFQTASGPFDGQDTAAVPLVVLGDLNAFEYTDGYVDMVGLISGTYDNAANHCDATLSDATPVDCDLPGGNLVDPPLYNAVLSVPADERYSYLFSNDLGAIQGSTGRDVPAIQVLDHILLARSAQGFFLAADFGIGNNAAADQTERDGTGAVGSSDHDGVVVYLNVDCTNDPDLNPDGDQVCGMLDNCPLAANDDQADLDGDGHGDTCDTLPDDAVRLFFDGFED